MKSKVARTKKKLKLGQVRIRKAVAADKAPILDICRKIWRGGDYVPKVWDDWLKENDGLLLVATVRGTPVGVAHGLFQTRDVAWLEGVRVHEQYRGLGIAGKLNRALTHWASERGARVARLCTGSSNIASRKHLERVRFRVLQTFQRVDSKRNPTNRPLGVVRPRRLPKGLWNWLQARPELLENRAMYSDGWTWHPLTQAALRRHSAEGRVLLTVRKNSPSSCCIFLDDDRRLTVGFAAGDLKDLTRSFSMLRFMMSRRNHDKVRALIPTKSSLGRALEKSGFKKTAKVLVYEKFLG